MLWSCCVTLCDTVLLRVMLCYYAGSGVSPVGVQPSGEAVPPGHKEIPHANVAHHQHQG